MKLTYKEEQMRSRERLGGREEERERQRQRGRKRACDSVGI